MNSRIGAFIGQASHNDLRIAINYKDSAQVLYDSKAYQDGISLPALFLVRQFLELSLKYNIRKLNEVSSSSNLMNELSNTHDLTKIHNSFIEHYTSVKRIKNISGLKEKKYLDALKDLINIISLLDSGSQGFRYTENTAGQKIIDQGEVFNLKDVFDLLNDSSNILVHTEDILGLN